MAAGAGRLPVVEGVRSVQKPFPAYQGNEPYIFVSYAHADASTAFPELRRLREHGFNVWYDEGINPGSNWTDDLASRVREAATVLYLVTPRSAASENCRNEIDYAIDCGRRILLVYLRPAELSEGLKFQIGRRQAILKYELRESDYHTKLLQSLEETSEVLRRVSAAKSIDTGLPSLYRVVQGLSNEDENMELKKELMSAIFEANVSLRERKSA